MNRNFIQKQLDERNKAIEEARNLVEFAEKENRDLSAEERAQFDRINTEVADKGKLVDDLLAAEERAKEADAARARYESLVGAESRDLNETVEDAIMPVIRGEVREITLMPDAETRDITKSNSANFVPTGFYNVIVATLQDSANFLKCGPTVIYTDNGIDMTVPRVTAYVDAEAVAEAANVSSETDFTDGVATLKAWKFKGFTQASEELVLDSGVNIVDFIGQNLGRQVGRAANVQYILGDGTTEPEGVFVGFSNAVTAASASLTMDNLIDLQHAVIAEYRQNGTWLMKDSTAAVVRKLKDNDNNYLWQPTNILGQPDLLLGRPVVTDANVAAIGTGNESVAYGDFKSGMIVRVVNGITVSRSDDFAFSTDLISFKAILKTDSKVVDTGAVKILVHS